MTGVSCHISAALQLIHHGIPELRNSLIRLADEWSSVKSIHTDTNASVEFLHELGFLFKNLLGPSGNGDDATAIAIEAIDPMPLYNVLPSSLNYANVGDAATALRAIFKSIQTGLDEMRKLQKIDIDVLAKVEKILLHGCICGSTVQRFEGKKRIISVNSSGNKIVKLIKRAKPERERPLCVPFPVPVRGYNSLESALRSVTAEAQKIVGYDWDLVTDFTETESEVGPYTSSDSSDDDRSSSSSSSDDNSEDESVSTSTSSDTSSSPSEDEEENDFDVWRTSKYTLLKTLPLHLLFHLKRFEYKNGKVQRLSRVLDIPAKLCTDSFSVDCSESTGNKTFVLRGAIVHIDEPVESSDGATCEDAGHYISYANVKSGPDTGGNGHGIETEMSACNIDVTSRKQQRQWIEINEEKVKIVTAIDGETGESGNTIEKYILDVFSGRYSRKKAAGTTTKYATVLLYERQHV